MFRRIWAFVSATPAVPVALFSLYLVPVSWAEFTCPYTKLISQGRIGELAYTDIWVGPGKRPAKIVYDPDYARRVGCDRLCLEFVVSGHECAHAGGTEIDTLQGERDADCKGTARMQKIGRWSPEMRAAIARIREPTAPNHDRPAERLRRVDECARKAEHLRPDAASLSAPRVQAASPLPAPAPQVDAGPACYYAVLGCFPFSTDAEAERARLGGSSLSVVNSRELPGLLGGDYCVRGPASTKEEAYTSVSSFRAKVPTAHVKKGC